MDLIDCGKGAKSEFNKDHSVSSMGDQLEVNENVGCGSGPGDMINAELNHGIPSGSRERLRR